MGLGISQVRKSHAAPKKLDSFTSGTHSPMYRREESDSTKLPELPRHLTSQEGSAKEMSNSEITPKIIKTNKDSMRRSRQIASKVRFADTIDQLNEIHSLGFTPESHNPGRMIIDHSSNQSTILKRNNVRDHLYNSDSMQTPYRPRDSVNQQQYNDQDGDE